jgi:hypothetical protein
MSSLPRANTMRLRRVSLPAPCWLAALQSEQQPRREYVRGTRETNQEK